MEFFYVSLQMKALHENGRWYRGFSHLSNLFSHLFSQPPLLLGECNVNLPDNRRDLPKFPDVKRNRFFRSRAILARNELRAKIQNGGFSRDEIAEDFELLIENLEDNVDDLAILSAVSRFSMWGDLNRIQGYFEINHSMLRANWLT